MPKLTENARSEFDRALASSLDRLFAHEEAAGFLAAFLEGEAMLVISRDQLKVLPVGGVTPPPADTPEPPMPGMYL